MARGPDLDAARVAHRWEAMEERFRLRGDDPAPQPLYRALAQLVPLLKALEQHPRLSRLWPFTSMATLRLSGTAHFPYVSEDYPAVRAVAGGRFRVFAPSSCATERYASTGRIVFLWECDILGEGDVAEAVALMGAALPSGGAFANEHGDDAPSEAGVQVIGPAHPNESGSAENPPPGRE